MIAYVPARMASKRLHGKPLIDIEGMPLVSRMVNICDQSDYIHQVIVLADDEEIAKQGSKHCPDSVEWLSGTSGSCGTDRAFRHVKKSGHIQPFVVVQCDCPDLSYMDLNHFLASIFSRELPVVHTMVCPMEQREAAQASNVKVAIGPHSKAWYFSRSMIPFGAEKFWKHLGVYAFLEPVLAKYIGPNFINKMPDIPHSAKSEDLEQLAWMAAGIDIHCLQLDRYIRTIDTNRDWIQWKTG